MAQFNQATEKIVFIGRGPLKNFWELFQIKSIELEDIEKVKPNIIFTTESKKQKTEEYLRKLKLDKEVIIYTFLEQNRQINQDQDLHNLISQALGIKI